MKLLLMQDQKKDKDLKLLMKNLKKKKNKKKLISKNKLKLLKKMVKILMNYKNNLKMLLQNQLNLNKQLSYLRNKNMLYVVIQWVKIKEFLLKILIIQNLLLNYLLNNGKKQKTNYYLMILIDNYNIQNLYLQNQQIQLNNLMSKKNKMHKIKREILQN